jgi:hypothetical protein
LRLDTSRIVREIRSSKEALELPAGTIVGDPHGGLTFTDAVAAALESRSSGGWHETRMPLGDVWTLIFLDR